MIWFINQLSRSYVSNANFDLEFVNVPEGYLFEKASKNQVYVRLRAGGFQFLNFNFKNKKVFVDLSQLEKKTETTFFATSLVYRKQIEKQLPNTMDLLEIDQDTLYFEMLPVITKKIPVQTKVELDLAKNYLLDGKLTITPDSVRITGPSEEIDSITSISTHRLVLPEVTSSFSENVELIQSSRLENTSYEYYRVNIKGEIARFSEKVFKLPIKKLNMPKGLELRTFPEEVSVLCKAKIKRLKEIQESDFQVVLDYNSVKATKNNTVSVKLTKEPEGLHSAKLLENKVEFIIKKQ